MEQKMILLRLSVQQLDQILGWYMDVRQSLGDKRGDELYNEIGRQVACHVCQTGPKIAQSHEHK